MPYQYYYTHSIEFVNLFNVVVNIIIDLGIDIISYSVEIFVDQDAVILRKFKRNCIFCGDGEDLMEYKGKPICPKCKDEIGK